LAPSVVDFIEDEEVGEVLIYEFYDGHSWPDGTAGLPAAATDGQSTMRPVAELLRRLHNLSAEGFRRVPVTPHEILAQGARFLPEIAQRADLEKIRPAAIEMPPLAAPRLLHTDVGPGNLIIGSAGLRLIDWQCPALGDPAEDLCAFLSPAFQILYGCGPLSVIQRAAFLDAYDDEATVRRLQVLEPFFHWRMASYCAMRRQRYLETRPQAATAYEKALVALVDILRR
ncbi:MAG: aminoglycoside phosphotransferase family protein, partial [Dongiaceae bacterium]